MKFRLWLESDGWQLYHGSNSEQISGTIRTNERDSGWFGSGFYLSAYPEYAKRWGEFVYRMSIPYGKYAQVVSDAGYRKINFVGDADVANKEAGGSEGWVVDEYSWSQKFTNALKAMGYDGVRVQIGDHPDLEVLVFNPQNIKILGRKTNA